MPKEKSYIAQDDKDKACTILRLARISRRLGSGGRAVSREEIARRANVSPHLVEKWEDGELPWDNRPKLLKLIAAYRLSRYEADTFLHHLGQEDLTDDEAPQFIIADESRVYLDEILSPQVGLLSGESDLRRDDDAIVEGLTKVFAGRATQLGQLDTFLEGPKGYALVAGVPGSGKSALLAKWVQQRRADSSIHLCYHFFWERRGRDRLSQFVANAAQQLSRARGGDSTFNKDEEDRNRQLVGDSLKKDWSANKLIVVIDAIDEASSDSRRGPACFYGLLPRVDELGDGVFVVLSAKTPTGDAGYLEVARYEDEIGTHFGLCLPLPNLSQRDDIIPLMQTIGGPQLPELSGDLEFVSRVKKRTGGLALYVRLLLDEMANRAQCGGSARDVLENTPADFEAYIRRARQELSQMPDGRRWVDLLGFLSCARGPLTRADVKALTQIDEPMLQAVPWQVTPWLASWNDGKRDYYSLSHPAYSDGWRSQNHEDRLLQYCRDWWSNGSIYALRYLPQHLRDGNLTVELWEVASDELFLWAQRVSLPEVMLPLNTVWQALEAACDCDDVLAIAKFLLRHARLRAQAAGEQPLLSILKKAGIREAWSLCELRHGGERALSYLFLAWHLARKGDWQSYGDTLRRLAECGVCPAPEFMSHEPEWQREATRFLVAQILDVDEKRGARVGCQVLTDEEKEKLAKSLALEGRFAAAKHLAEAITRKDEPWDETWTETRAALDIELYRHARESRAEKAKVGSKSDSYRKALDDLEGIAKSTIPEGSDEQGEIYSAEPYMYGPWPETLERVAEVLDKHGRHPWAGKIREWLRSRGYAVATAAHEETREVVDEGRQRQEEEDALRQARALQDLKKREKDPTDNMVVDALRPASSAKDDALFDWILEPGRGHVGEVAVRMAKRGNWQAAWDILQAMVDPELFRRTCADLAEVAREWRGQIAVQGTSDSCGGKEFACELLQAGLGSASSELRFSRKDMSTLVDLARGFASLAEMDKAEEALDILLCRAASSGQDPPTVAVVAKVGETLLQVGRAVEAADLLREALRLWKTYRVKSLYFDMMPLGAELYLTISRKEVVAGLAAAGHMEEAIAEARAESPYSNPSLLALVRVLVAQGKLEKATEVALEIPAVGNEAKEALAAIGIAYARKGDLERGLSVVRHPKSLAVRNEDYLVPDPEMDYLYENYWSLRKRGREEEARALLEAGTAEVSALLYIERAAVAGSENSDQVNSWLDSALKVASLIPWPDKRSNVLSSIGQLFAKVGDVEKALSIAEGELLGEVDRSSLVVGLVAHAGKAGKLDAVCDWAGKLVQEKQSLCDQIKRLYDHACGPDWCEEDEVRAQEAEELLRRDDMFLAKWITYLALGMARGGAVEEALRLIPETGGDFEWTKVLREIGHSLARAGRVEDGYSLAESVQPSLERKGRAWLLLGMGEELAGTSVAEAAKALRKALAAVLDLVNHTKGDAVEMLLLGRESLYSEYAELEGEPEPGLLCPLAKLSSAVGEVQVVGQVLHDVLQQYLAGKGRQVRERGAIWREVVRCLLALGETERALAAARGIDGSRHRDASLMEISTFLAVRGDMAKAIPLVNLVSDTSRPRLAEQLGMIAVEQGRKDDLKLLMPFATQRVWLAHAFCPMLVELYGPDPDVIRRMVKEIAAPHFSGSFENSSDQPNQSQT